MKPSTEKTSRVLEQAGLEAARKNPPSRLTTNQKPKPGHGRNGAEAYCGAVRIPIAHRSLSPRDRNPHSSTIRLRAIPSVPRFRLLVRGEPRGWILPSG